MIPFLQNVYMLCLVACVTCMENIETENITNVQN